MSDLNTLRADVDLIWVWAMGAKAEVEARRVAAMAIFMVCIVLLVYDKNESEKLCCLRSSSVEK